MENFIGKVAVVTGAASGIGRALALALAKEGCRLALSDIDAPELEALAQSLKDRGVMVHATKVDVASREAVYAWAEDVLEVFGEVHLVFNNAGVTLVDTVEQSSYEDIEWLMQINFWGVVYGTKAFLPALKRAQEGHIVNISSVFGFVGIPGQSAYNASKFAVRGFTEALRIELALERSPVSVSSVHPGGIDTNIARKSRYRDVSSMLGERETTVDRFHKVARTSPETAAAVILRGVRQNRPRILIGFDARVIDIVQRVFPEHYYLAVQRAVRWLNESS